MNIYNFMGQKYTTWKKTGKSEIKFPTFGRVILTDQWKEFVDQLNTIAVI